MADAEEENWIPRLVELEDKMRQLVLRHQEYQEWQAQLQAQAQVDLAQEAEDLKIVRMFEELGYVKH
jgi:hypothetical protein